MKLYDPGGTTCLIFYTGKHRYRGVYWLLGCTMKKASSSLMDVDL